MQSKTPRPNHIFSQLLSLSHTDRDATEISGSISHFLCLSAYLLHFLLFSSPTHWLAPSPHMKSKDLNPTFHLEEFLPADLAYDVTLNTE